jgi:crotonobetainyl-CoA:carnitine CoA-transferase CaiB-like acyl-CoA transferase
VIGLRDLRVVDLSTGTAGAYCTKLFADAGADVIKVEPPGGDPLRRWSAGGADLGNEDGALFRFLAGGKRSVEAGSAELETQLLCAGADLVVESFAPERFDAAALCERHPGLVVLSLTPWGRSGPWAARPATEFIVQAESGSLGTRGLPGAEPFQAGGRITEWLAGTFSAVAALAAVQRARRTGHGEHVDFSLLEVMNVAGSNYVDLFWGLLGRPPVSGAAQNVETPSIEPTADGYVGFCTNSAQQFSDFLLLIGHPELREDRQLFQVAGRLARFEWWTDLVKSWTTEHSTAEIVEQASLLRIPVAPVNDGERVLQHEQLVARGAFRKDPSGAFVAPRPPYQIDFKEAPPPRPAPHLGEHTGRVEERVVERRAPDGPPRLPLEGLRVLDFTAWWAGPSATWMLASLGADVIHVEAVQRIDGMRATGGAFMGRKPRWWEYSFFYLAANTNKRGLTLNLQDPRGLDLARKLIAQSDAVVENYTPRVMEGFGLTWDAIHATNPNAIYVRMPAFGLDGPWRDHTGFAQTMEQLTGLAWVTGHAKDQPRIQRGPCDPLAGMHATFALLVALEERERLGRGVHVECTMVEGALNAAAEVAIEFSAYGGRLVREGNRSPAAAPQGLYPCVGHDAAASPRWLALSVESDEQWLALRALLGDPDWARDPDLAHRAGRRAAHDTIDAELRPWFAARERDDAIAALVEAGVPAGAVADPRTSSAHPQLSARGFHETIDHPEVGEQATPGLPFRYASVERWLRRPAPTLGQHNHEILSELGLTDEEIAALAAAKVIGDHPEGLS